ncbi:MAG: ATP-binding cassette domain-containing protein [Lentisphaeria bacterium]|nr:ATP-binding cassette domain-containing protein [Lentisphaeria bacterium]NQZ67238.1 ATP-binding cassette domain-containing protein [Lentisphaeria bacterium]
MSTIVSVKNASVFIKRNQALDNINWDVQAGEQWFILGLNGSGKSTLMNLVMGYLRARLGGEVNVLGYEYGKCVMQEVRQHIGWISAHLQDWTYKDSKVIYVVCSGLDSTIGLYRDVRPEEEDEAMDLLEELGIADLCDRQFADLSSGEQMKVLIARMRIAKPDILVLDEPCSHLDIQSREEFLTIIRELCQQENPPLVLFVTHRIDDIIPELSHGLILRDGKIIANGLKEDILNEENIQDAFKVPVKIQESAGRYWPFL